MNIRKSFVAVLATLVSMLSMAETATVDGLLWQYSVAGGAATVEKLLTPGVENVVIPSEINGAKVTIIGDGAFERNETIKSVVISEGIRQIGNHAFELCRYLRSAKLPESLETIGKYAFSCSCLRSVRLPQSLKFVGEYSFEYSRSWVVVEGDAIEISSSAFGCDSYSMICGVEFLSGIPKGIESLKIFSDNSKVCVLYPKKFAETWSAIVPPKQFGGYVPENKCVMSVVSGMRESHPTIMDVKVIPTSAKSEVKIRPIAFLNGVDNFANIIKVKTFADGTESVIQNPIKSNRESVFSWNVAADLSDKVAKLKMDVMCVEDDIIPFELVSIPASSGHAAMTISRNAIALKYVRDALLWLMADPSSEIKTGTYFNPQMESIVYLALFKSEKEVGRCSKEILDYFYGGQLNPEPTLNQMRNGNYDFQLCDKFEVKKFVLEELGYTILEGDNLEYARKMTGLKLENGPYVKMK